MGEKLCGSCFGARDKAVSEAASEAEEVVVSDESSSSELLTSDPDEGLSDLDIWANSIKGYEKRGVGKTGGLQKKKGWKTGGL